MIAKGWWKLISSPDPAYKGLATHNRKVWPILTNWLAINKIKEK